MSQSVECPTCGWKWMKPFGPGLRGTTWTDDCACSDFSPCLKHQFCPEDAPERPSDDVILARAQAEHERALVEWEKKKLQLSGDET